MKRDLRRPTDVEADRQERERTADDAEELLYELQHPAIGLHSDDSLAQEPALRRIVELVREQMERIRKGEVDDPSAQAPSPVLCPHCSAELIAKVTRGHYCDSPDCGAPPAFRCPN